MINEKNEVISKSTAYEIVREIGGGGMGVVFLARDRRTEKKVAYKTMKPEFADHPILRKRFSREVRIHSDLEHPNIIRIITFDTDAPRPWLMMDYCKAGTLSDVLGSCDAKHVIELFMQGCSGIAHAHSRGVLHRDIKPDNFLVGNDGLVKVSDFGLAAYIDRDTTPITPSGRDGALGTYGFMSPEQIANSKHVNATADIYSLGTTLYYILTDSLPGAHTIRPAVLREGLSKGEEDQLFNVIYQSIERQAEKRPSSVDDFVMSIRDAVGFSSASGESSTALDADLIIEKILAFDATVLEDEKNILRQLQHGDEITASHVLSERYGMRESPEWWCLHQLKKKGLVTFREQDHSSGKYIRNFYLVDVAITSLGLAFLRYLDRA